MRPIDLNATALPLRPAVFFVEATRSNYQSYNQRAEKYNRSQWCSGRVLAFKTIGRGFPPLTCFVFFRRRRRVRLLAAAYDLPLRQDMYTLHVLNATIITHNTRPLGLIKENAKSTSEKEKGLAGCEPTTYGLPIYY